MDKETAVRIAASLLKDVSNNDVIRLAAICNNEATFIETGDCTNLKNQLIEVRDFLNKLIDIM